MIVVNWYKKYYSRNDIYDFTLSQIEEYSRKGKQEGHVDLKEIQQIDGVCVSTQQIINVEGGDILHAIKNDEESFKSFGKLFFYHRA